MSERIAVYAGYFDPLTLGHKNIVERGSAVFDQIVVAVAADSPKQALLSPDERVDIIRKVFDGNPSVLVDRFEGLLVNYLRERKYKVLLRGIRTVSDFEYEYQMALANKTLDKKIETFFMMTEGEYSYLSSTLIKEIDRLGGDISKMVPPEVVKKVKEKNESK